MNRERFEMLAEAYGGALERWPADAQAPARALLAADPRLSAVLTDADRLDAFLYASPEPDFGGVLRERLIGSAPRRAPSWRRPQRWMAGAGLAAACVIGVFTGATYSDVVVGDPVIEALNQAGSSFDQTGILALEEIG